jgi:TonB family protein
VGPRAKPPGPIRRPERSLVPSTPVRRCGAYLALCGLLEGPDVSPRLFLFLLVGIAHVVAIWVVVRPIQPSNPDPQRVLAAMVGSVEVEPIERFVPVNHRPSLRKVHVDVPTTLDVIAPPVTLEAATAAPKVDPSYAPVDTHSFAMRAGLTPGQGATVVLRIEVRPDGTSGRVIVEVSSGRPQVDAAAVDAARAEHWIPGVVGGEPKAVWIRWGIHLQA